jgi:hypothetical protein
LYDWVTIPRKDIRDVISSQAANTQAEFDRRAKDVILQFAEQVNKQLFFIQSIFINTKEFVFISFWAAACAHLVLFFV